MVRGGGKGGKGREGKGRGEGGGCKGRVRTFWEECGYPRANQPSLIYGP